MIDKQLEKKAKEIANRIWLVIIFFTCTLPVLDIFGVTHFPAWVNLLPCFIIGAIFIVGWITKPLWAN